MKKITVTAITMALALLAANSYAANSLSAGAFGLNVPVITSTASTNTNINSPLLSGKYLITRDLAILAGFGFNSGGPSGNSTTTFAIMGGVRKYFKVDDFAPFAGGSLAYESTSTSPSSTTAMVVAAEAGAEYFLAKQFSIEGKVNFGYRSTDNGTTKASYFGTSTANLSVNYYF